MTSKELRQKYLDFFKSKKHAVIPSASLIPENDPTTLFISSGMQPMISYLLGEKHPEGTRIVDSQKCFRDIDIEEVGNNRHLTFFEMLGNWSLGDYFKKEQLNWIFEFLTKELNLDPNKMYVTVFRGNEAIGIAKDSEAVEVWKDIFKSVGIQANDVDLAEKNGMQDGRIFYYDDTKNWWSRSGVPDNMPVGEPGGPDSEVFYDLGANLKLHEKSSFKNQKCHINCDCGRFVEIGNSVFMEFIKTKKGFEPLSQKNVDFGGGFERMVMMVQGKTSPFETDLFENSIKNIEELSNKKYQESEKITKAMRIIAEHIRAATFLMGDDKGISPSNLDQGYVIRRLIRRAIRYGRQLGIEKKLWVKEIVQTVIDDYSDVYQELGRNKTFVIEQVDQEETKFKKTLEKGLREFEKGIDPFVLFTTYGFPIEMTQELAKEKGEKVDIEKFNEQVKKHQELSRTASVGKFKSGLADNSEATTKLHTAAHLLLAALRKILGDHVIQRGSNITSERLRLDFSHKEKLTDEQKQKVEDLVNKAIEEDLPINCEEMPLAEAKKRGVMGVFESKYGEKVKVYTVCNKNDNFSCEICAGPHVERTGQLGHFKIAKEQSSSAGVRRIKAILD